jgi:predicted O-methyltransferase YrrM
MNLSAFAAVDSYIVDRLVPDDPAWVLQANAKAGLPAIDVSPAQGRLLALLVRIAGARRVLEVGTLGAYSTIWMGRALPADGRLVTLEAEPRHAAVARDNLARAGLSDRVTLMEGPAARTLPGLDGPFDLVFIDADKPGNPTYLREAVRLSRPGTVIVLDNVVRGGRVAEEGTADPSIEGTRAAFDLIASNPRLSATAIQTVGAKGWDGFAIMIVD